MNEGSDKFLKLMELTAKPGFRNAGCGPRTCGLKQANPGCVHGALRAGRNISDSIETPLARAT
jgi:hypothetical protein